MLQHVAFASESLAVSHEQFFVAILLAGLRFCESHVVGLYIAQESASHFLQSIHNPKAWLCKLTCLVLSSMLHDLNDVRKHFQLVKFHQCRRINIKNLLSLSVAISHPSKLEYVLTLSTLLGLFIHIYHDFNVCTIIYKILQFSYVTGGAGKKWTFLASK